MLSSLLSTPRLVWAGALCNFTGCFLSGGYPPIIPFLVSRSDVGFLLSVQGLSGCAALVPIGLAVDRFGAHKVVELGILLMAIGVVLTGMAQDFSTQFCSRLAIGVSSGMTFNAGMALIMEKYQSSLRAEYIGVFLGITMSGKSVGPLVAGHIFTMARDLGLPQPQGWAFSPAFLMLGAAYFMLESAPDKPLAAPLRQGSALDGSENDALAGVVKETAEKEGDKAKVSIARQLFRLCFGVYAAAGVRAVVLAVTLTYLFGSLSAVIGASAVDMQAMGLMADKIAWACVPAWLLQVFVNPWAGRMASDAARRQYLMILGPLLSAVVLLVVAAMPSLCPDSAFASMVFAMLMCSLAVSLGDTPSILLMSDLASMNGCGYGEAMTATELAVTLGDGAGSGFGVYMVQQFTFEYLCLVLSGAAMVISISCTVFLRNIPHHAHDDDDEIACVNA
eukprot:TRINITY_DN16415_c0_g1_i1.p1 TRINITY_DN16415_c0_g1~~TRINITY_DN16415_c0_g1_i1.p1  ORF type:complete len:449 (+),score=37.57 TRINITY_DN16415_c0_g1_i1:175-1521(+)